MWIWCYNAFMHLDINVTYIYSYQINMNVKSNKTKKKKVVSQMWTACLDNTVSSFKKESENSPNWGCECYNSHTQSKLQTQVPLRLSWKHIYKDAQHQTKHHKLTSYLIKYSGFKPAVSGPMINEEEYKGNELRSFCRVCTSFASCLALRLYFNPPG